MGKRPSSERRILREAAKRELEKDIRELGEAIKDKDDIEWEDIVEAHGMMLRSWTKVGEAHMSYLELAGDREEGSNSAWFREVERVFRVGWEEFRKLERIDKEEKGRDVGEVVEEDGGPVERNQRLG